MLLSIIIPIYNCDKYLEDCLKSCFSQNVDLSLYQVICVNDGSTDNSMSIINKYKKMYSNLIVLEQSQSGVSKARNFGLSISQGEYIWFIDADDFIEENIIKDFSHIILNYHPDRIKVMSYCFHDVLSERQIELVRNHQIKSNYPYKNTQITRTIISREYIYKHDIKFYECLSYGEDAIFNYETRLYSPKDYTYRHVCYFYRTHDDSATSIHSKIKRKKYIDSCKEAIRIETNYYNNRINMKITTSVIEYWINMMLEQYFYYGSLEYYYTWDKNSLQIRNIDVSLKRLNLLCDKIYRFSDYNALQQYVIVLLKKRENKQERKNKRKIVIERFKHPKRLLKA